MTKSFKNYAVTKTVTRNSNVLRVGEPRSYWLHSSSVPDVSPRESTSDGASGISRGPGVPIRPDQVSSVPAPLFPDSPPTPVMYRRQKPRPNQNPLHWLPQIRVWTKPQFRTTRPQGRRPQGQTHATLVY